MVHHSLHSDNRDYRSGFLDHGSAIDACRSWTFPENTITVHMCQVRSQEIEKTSITYWKYMEVPKAKYCTTHQIASVRLATTE